MAPFDLKRGEVVSLLLRGTGFDRMHVTVSGRTGVDDSVPLLVQSVEARGSTAINWTHDFHPGKLDDFDQLQVDPVLYGRAGSRYDLTASLRNESDDSPTLVHEATGTLGPAHGAHFSDGAAGFDSPLIIVELNPSMKFTFHYDENAGAYIIDAETLGLSPRDCGWVTMEPDTEAEIIEKFEPLEPRKFEGITFPELNADDFGGAALGEGPGEGQGGTIFRQGPGGSGREPRGFGTIADHTLGGSYGARVPKIEWPEERKTGAKKSGAAPPPKGGARKGSRSGPRKKGREKSVIIVDLSSVPAADPDVKQYPVWYATNRAPVLRAGSVVDYSPYRDEGAVHYGRCIVRVPKSHKIGEVGSPLWKRWITLTDDRLKIDQLVEIEQAVFWAGMSQQLAQAGAGRRHAVVFIHGYNVSFQSAAIRTAQLGCDLSIEGAMAFYSWPSRATLEGYPADESTVQASAKYITQFLVDVVNQSGAEQVHVIAHSMGNRAIVEAVRSIVGAAREETGVRFSQFILAAPDVDAEYFKQFATAYSQAAKRTTMYVSDRDHAVRASRFLHGGVPRVGLAPPFQIIDGIDTVNAGRIVDSLLGHGYVAESWQLLVDMHQLIHLDAAPADRFSVKPASDPAGKYWELTARD